MRLRTVSLWAVAVRVAVLLLLCLLIAPGTWLRDAPVRPSEVEALRLTPLQMPDAKLLRAELGSFRLEGVWSLDSPHERFGGYSGLVVLPDGKLLAVSDQGDWMRFAPPGSPPEPPRFGPVPRGGSGVYKSGRDAEAVTIDPASGTLWIAWEGRHRISRHSPGWKHHALVRPPAMRRWGRNSGPEALARLRNGQFLVLGEGFTGWFDNRRHPGLLFPADPILGGKPIRFAFEGAEAFSPTDAAQLPDGRVLILMRRLVWPMPFRFVGRIMIADPRAIRAGKVWRAREVARLGSLLPVDNFEGLALAPQLDGTVTAWIISDDNDAVSQRTLLWKLSLDPRELR